MNWTHFVVALVVTAVAISLTDWLLFGVLFHGRYMDTPEVWRKMPEKKQIAGSMLIAICAAAIFFHFCTHWDVHGFHQAISIAMLIWLVGVLPITITTTLFVKYNPALAVSHSLGYLARLIVAAWVYGWLLG